MAEVAQRQLAGRSGELDGLVEEGRVDGRGHAGIIACARSGSEPARRRRGRCGSFGSGWRSPSGRWRRSSHVVVGRRRWGPAEHGLEDHDQQHLRAGAPSWPTSDWESTTSSSAQLAPRWSDTSASSTSAAVGARPSTRMRTVVANWVSVPPNRACSSGWARYGRRLGGQRAAGAEAAGPDDEVAVGHPVVGGEPEPGHRAHRVERLRHGQELLDGFVGGDLTAAESHEPHR